MLITCGAVLAAIRQLGLLSAADEPVSSPLLFHVNEGHN